MQVTHDDDLGGIMMIPLMVQWRIEETCCIEDCFHPTTTIMVFSESETPTRKTMAVGICEKHHDEVTRQKKFHYTVSAHSGRKAKALSE